MNDTNGQHLQTFELKSGDLLVDSVGAEVRFWRVKDKSVVRIGTSRTFMGQRALDNVCEGGKVTYRPAKDLTVARVYSRKDRKLGADLVRSYFPEFAGATVHIFYAGCGPSGQRWGFHTQSHYSFPPEVQ